MRACVVSFPRSGRHLIHKALTAGYGFSPRHIDRKNPEAKNWPIIVSHNTQPYLDADGRHCIVMIREPFEALVSFLKLDFPKEVTLAKFRQVLAGPNDGGPTDSGWLEYYKRFARHHVLSTDYPNPRLIVGYEQLMARPQRTLLEMAMFLGGEFDLAKALKATGPIEFKHNHLKSPLYSPELKGEIERALQPEVGMLRERGII